ncbi:MAG: GNAT family N-acetyltransferase [Saprospiraceae bacterium]|nr:GNAT family N-acetyltransferase [Saprospiraceae bacterium]
MKIILETERLILRQLVPSDDIGMFELDSNPEVHKYLGNKPVTNIEECRSIIESVQKQYLENGIGRWAMIEKSSGNFTGWTGLKFIKDKINNHVDFYEVGYRIIQEYWGKGYAAESTKASLKYAFENLNAKEVFGITNVENLKSRKVLEKCGLKFIETFVWHEWHEVNCNWLKITKEEWERQT